MQPLHLAGLGAALGAALAIGGASCAPGARTATVEPVVRDSLLGCAAQQAAGYGFVIYKREDLPADQVELIRATDATGSSVKFDGLVFSVVRADTASRPEVRVHMFSGIAWGGASYAGSQELDPRPEVVTLAEHITTVCRNGGPSRTHRYQRVQ